MLVWFNKKGVLREQLDSYGNLPRVGSQNFKIYAYFEDLNISENYPSAYIRLQKPDFVGSRYPVMWMSLVYLSFQNGIADGASQFFRPGGGPGPNGTYPCFMFDFSSIKDVYEVEDIDDDVTITLLDTPGLWKATITLIGNSSLQNVVGTMTFNVDGDEGEEEENEIDPRAILNNFADVLASKLNIRNGIFVLPSTDSDLSGFSVGQIFYVESESQFYRLEEVDHTNTLVPFDIFDTGQYLTTEDTEYVIPPEDR